ncbi:MAG: tetratricopeptide repeat protein [Candidatus Nealsonbacteria bacterium]|nr:tetratricopeptide repeat protein [Candidatus Nealsonbacteria bacterium]
MRHLSSLHLIAGALATVLATGCQLTGGSGPVSKSLATCRQLSQQGIAAAERGQMARAEKLLSQAVLTYPLDPESRRNYADVLWQQGTPKEAIEQMKEAARLADEDATIRVRLAEMYLATGQIDLARANANLAIDLDPKLPTAWAIRGDLARTQGDLDRALADYHHVLGYIPNDRRITLEIAEIYRHKNRPDRALATLQSLADSYPPGEEPPRVSHLLGNTLVALGRYDEGIENLAAAINRTGPTPELLCSLGEAELLAGRPAAAAAQVRQALALKPQHKPARQLLQRIELASRPVQGLN